MMRPTGYIIRLPLVGYAIALAGCVDTGSLHPPCSSCMIAPAALEDVKPGEDAVRLLAAQRAQYAKVAARLRALQRYVRTVTK